MEDLIKKIATEAGITDKQAKIVVESLTGYLVSVLPEQCVKQIETRFGIYAKIESPFTLTSPKDLAIVAGITEEQAKIAIDVYVNFTKTEMSDDCAAQIEGYVRGAG